MIAFFIAALSAVIAYFIEPTGSVLYFVLALFLGLIVGIIILIIGNTLVRNFLPKEKFAKEFIEKCNLINFEENGNTYLIVNNIFKIFMFGYESNENPLKFVQEKKKFIDIEYYKNQSDPAVVTVYKTYPRNIFLRFLFSNEHQTYVVEIPSESTVIEINKEDLL